jgi:hypothetical protein
MTYASTRCSRRPGRRLGIVLAGFALVLAAAAGGAGAVAHPRAMSTTMSPNPGPINYLRGVTAISPDDVWAVGMTQDRASRSMTLHWDGSAWTHVASPSPGTTSTYLSDVSAAATDDVWAIGDSLSPGTPWRSFAIHWDGADWTRFSTPNPSARQTHLSAVSTASPSDAWAVGYYIPNGGSTEAAKTLVLHWDGVSWSRVPSQNGGLGWNALNDVAAITPTDLVAAGWFGWSGTSRVLALDGPSWTRAFPPTAGLGSVEAIGASSTSDVWFVGDDLDQELMIHWDGTSWSRSEPSPDLSRPELYGVAATSPDDAWAVGVVQEFGPTRTLLQHWDGTEWTRIASPNPGGLGDSNLWDVTATSASDAWAVGDYLRIAADGSNHGWRTLILHWDGASWTRM